MRGAGTLPLREVLLAGDNETTLARLARAARHVRGADFSSTAPRSLKTARGVARSDGEHRAVDAHAIANVHRGIRGAQVEDVLERGTRARREPDEGGSSSPVLRIWSLVTSDSAGSCAGSRLITPKERSKKRSRSSRSERAPGVALSFLDFFRFFDLGRRHQGTGRRRSQRSSGIDRGGLGTPTPTQPPMSAVGVVLAAP